MHFRNFLRDFSKFPQNFQQIVVLVQTREKLTHGSLNFFEKYAKIMHFPNFLKIFEKLSPLKRILATQMIVNKIC